MKISEDEANRGLLKIHQMHKERAAELEKHIKKLKDLLLGTQKEKSIG